MEKEKVIHAASLISSELISEIQIDGDKHPVLMMSISTISQVIPDIENVVQDIVKGKKPIDSATELGKKVYEIAIVDNRLKAENSVSQSINPEILKTAAISNPYALLIVAALSLIEKDVKKILDVTKDILSFLESEKQAEAEADVKTLFSITSKFSANHDNEKFLTNNHKLVLDIQRTARKNMLFYQKRISKLAKGKSFTISQSNVKTFFEKLEKEFKYYQMAIQAFSLASFLEIILGGNFLKENIALIKDEIIEVSNCYIDYHSMCLEKIKKDSHNSIETNVVKGSGKFTEAIGKIFLKSKKEKNLERGEKLVAKGEQLEEKSLVIEKVYIDSFISLSSPGSEMFIEKMEELLFIFNKTNHIYCDTNNLYLVGDKGTKQ